MCEDYPCCGHDLNNCPEQSMEDYYDWSMDDDDWYTQPPLTPEEKEQERRSENQLMYDEMIGEMYASRYAFD